MENTNVRYYIIISCCFLTNFASGTNSYEIGGIAKGTVPRYKIKKGLYHKKR